MKRCLITIGFWVACALSVRADEVIELVNGDRISGEVIKVESGTVYLRSKLLGDLEFPQDSIKSDLAALLARTAAPPAPVEVPAGPVMAVAPAPQEAHHPEFNLRKTLHIPEQMKGDLKLSGYRRERDYVEDALNVAPRLTWNNQKHSWDWSLNYRYRRDNRATQEKWVQRDDRMTIEQKYRYNFDKTVFAQSRTFWEKDRVKSIDPRVFQSAGLGLYVLNSETLKFDVTPGVGYEYVDNAQTKKAKVMPTFDQSFQWVINSHFSYTQSFSWLGGQSEYQYDIVNELEARLNNNFSVVFEHRLDYDKQLKSNSVIDSRDERTSASVRLRF